MTEHSAVYGKQVCHSHPAVHAPLRFDEENYLLQRRAAVPGPGRYGSLEQSSTVGSKMTVSSLRTGSSSKFSKSKSPQRPKIHPYKAPAFISAQHAKGMAGLDSPGPASYSNTSPIKAAQRATATLDPMVSTTSFLSMSGQVDYMQSNDDNEVFGQSTANLGGYRPSSSPVRTRWRESRAAGRLSTDRNPPSVVLHGEGRFTLEEISRKDQINSPGPGAYHIPGGVGSGQPLSYKRRSPAFGTSSGPGPGAVTHVKAKRTTEYKTWKKLQHDAARRSPHTLLNQAGMATTTRVLVVSPLGDEGGLSSTGRLVSPPQRGEARKGGSLSPSPGGKSGSVAKNGRSSVILHPTRKKSEGKGRDSIGFTDYVRREGTESWPSEEVPVTWTEDREAPGAIALSRSGMKVKERGKDRQRMEKGGAEEEATRWRYGAVRQSAKTASRTAHAHYVGGSTSYLKKGAKRRGREGEGEGERGEQGGEREGEGEGDRVVRYVPLCSSQYPRWKVRPLRRDEEIDDEMRKAITAR